jgi:hypothetical protein
MSCPNLLKAYKRHWAVVLLNSRLKGIGASAWFEGVHHISRVFKKVHGMALRDFSRSAGR